MSILASTKNTNESSEQTFTTEGGNYPPGKINGYTYVVLIN
jgi:hypothetical protein